MDSIQNINIHLALVELVLLVDTTQIRSQASAQSSLQLLELVTSKMVPPSEKDRYIRNLEKRVDKLSETLTNSYNQLKRYKQEAVTLQKRLEDTENKLKREKYSKPA